MSETNIHAESNRIIGLYVAKQEAEAKASAKKKKVLTENQCHDIYVEAYEAGLNAGKDADTPKFIIGDAIGLSDEIDFSKKTYILDGLCGFAWVKISPARGAFVNYLKSRGVGNKAYYGGGYDIWVREFGQSVDRKAAFAGAFAEVLNKHGITAYAESRLD
jgi:hypothetical protein